MYIFLFLLMYAASGWAEALQDEADRINYSVGYQIGSDFKRQNVELRPESLLKGIQDAYAGNPPLLDPSEMRRTLIELKKRIITEERERLAKEAEENLAQAKAFLEKNAAKEGVVVLPSGLQYKVLKKGSGKSPGPKDIVVIHYRGQLIDGTEFDNSYKRGKPAKFPLDQLIPGLREALQKMRVGDKWEIFIPPELGYGRRGAGRIPPNSALIFEVELLDIEPSKEGVQTKP